MADPLGEGHNVGACFQFAAIQVIEWFTSSGCELLLSGCELFLSGCELLLSGCELFLSGCELVLSGCELFYNVYVVTMSIVL